jgi:hypothetical protein
MIDNETDNVIKTSTTTNILLCYRNNCSYDKNYLDLLVLVYSEM